MTTGVILLPPGWDAGPSQGYPPSISSSFPENSLVTIYDPEAPPIRSRKPHDHLGSHHSPCESSGNYRIAILQVHTCQTNKQTIKYLIAPVSHKLFQCCCYFFHVKTTDWLVCWVTRSLINIMQHYSGHVI